MKRRYFKDNEDYLSWLSKWKDEIDVIRTYYSKNKLCCVYNNIFDKEGRKIYEFIEESPYMCEVYEMKFYFSSNFNKFRFKEKLNDYIHYENKKIENKYQVPIDLVKYLAVCLYKRIEKRGFRVLYKNKKIDKEFRCYYG